jgi:GGDEF domain-containing protein
MQTRELRDRLRIQDVSVFRQSEKSYLDAVESAQQKLAEAKRSGASEDEQKRLEQALEIAKLEHESFVWDHDTTGALKNERFGQQMRETLDQEMQLGRDKQGRVVCEAGDPTKTHVLLVNMGELDRLNDAGEHSLGDRALEKAVQRILGDVESSRGDGDAEAGVQIYRVASNDFQVVLKNASPEMATRVSQAIAEKSLDVSEYLHAGQKDEAPLTVASFSLDEALATYNKLPRKKEALGTERESDATDLITIIREKAQTISDYEKTTSRLERMIADVVAAGDDAQKRASIGQNYEKYMKKSLGELFASEGEVGAMDFSTFVERARQRGAFDRDASAWRQEVHASARNEALKQLSLRLSTDRRTAQAVAVDAEKAFQKRLKDGSARSDVDLPESAPRSSERIFPQSTEDEKNAFEQRMDALGKTSGEVHLVELQAELAACEEGTPEAKIAQKKLEIEKKKRDYLTGLSGRGVYYMDLESRMRENVPTSVIAVDMAFLKYFDREGGSKTGDRAIRSAARIMDAVTRRLQAEHPDLGPCEAYRTGGDEFMMMVGSGDPAMAEEATRLVRQLALQIGGVPSDEGGSGRYRPTELQFNFGQLTLVDPKSDLEQRGLDTADPRQMADSATRRADEGIGTDKAVSRLVFLIEKDLENAGDPSGEVYLGDLTARSEKAIFDGAGAARVKAWADAIRDRLKSGEQIKGEILQFVSEQMAQKHDGRMEYSEQRDANLVNALTITLLERDLASAFSEVHESHLRYQELAKKHQELRGELRTARTEREKVASLREKIEQFRGSVG